MVELDEEALVHAKTNSRERKLNAAEKLAVYAFSLKGVPAKILARVFNVRPNAIYYITNWEHTAAHQNVKTSFERLGAERVWSEIVTEAWTEEVNADLRKLMQGKPLNDRRSRRVHRRQPRARRTGTSVEPPQTGSHEEGGSAQVEQ